MCFFLLALVSVGVTTFSVSFVVSDIPGISNSDSVRLRFTASDLNDGSVIEAGVDAVRVSAVECDEPANCSGDTNGDEQINVEDLLAVIGSWAQFDPTCDFDGSGTVDVADLLIVIAAWGSCL